MALILLVITISGLYVLKHVYWFNTELMGNVVLQQEVFTSKYHLFNKEGELLVSNVEGWIIDKDAIYGTNAGSGFFFVTNDKSSPGTEYYSTSTELNKILKVNGYRVYDLKYEENTSHLKFGIGKRRKYPIYSEKTKRSQSQ